MNLEQMPNALVDVQASIKQLDEKMAALLAQKWERQEPPINSKELMRRLEISEPTLIRMRKAGKIPFMNIGGQYRYDWEDVLVALKSKSK